MWCTECCSFLIQSSQSPPCNSPQHWIFSTQKDCGIHFPWFDYLAKEQQSPLCSWKNDLKNWCGFWLAAHPSTQGASMIHNISTANWNWVECKHAEIYHAPACMEGKTFHPCCMILCTLVWLIKSVNEANTIPLRHDFYSHNCLQCHIS